MLREFFGEEATRDAACFVIQASDEDILSMQRTRFGLPRDHALSVA